MMKSKMSTPTPNRVLGVDPGFDRVGIAILEKDNLLFSTCIETNRKESHAKRLEQIGKTLHSVIKKWDPASLAIESLFFNQNTTNALKVSEARGVILYEAALKGLTIFEYSPQAIKIAVTGYGKADKKQVETMVQKLVKMPLNSVQKLDDELDAIAVGITHLATQKSI
jgi:crossover junction endodeoxyribonuclease RuvC